MKAKIAKVEADIDKVTADIDKVTADIDKVSAEIEKCMYLPRLFEAFMQVSFRGTIGS